MRLNIEGRIRKVDIFGESCRRFGDLVVPGLRSKLLDIDACRCSNTYVIAGWLFQCLYQVGHWIEYLCRECFNWYILLIKI